LAGRAYAREQLLLNAAARLLFPALQTNKTRRCVRGAFAGAGVILVRA